MTMQRESVRFEPAPFPSWRSERSDLRVCFTGRTGVSPAGLQPARADVLEALAQPPDQVAWLVQRHSDIVRAASLGNCGEGDGLWTQERRLTLSIVTADCVPVVAGNEDVVAVIHAGWRGLVAGVIGATLADLPASPSDLEAWLGPAIGACCYEVGEDVAEQVVTASAPRVASAGPTARPHLDLHQAAELQLRRLGVRHIHRVEVCTMCRPDLLHSYRRSGGSGGRNHTFAWLAA